MEKIAVISDTHGLLREEVRARLIEADYIFHAGDVDTPELAREIEKMGKAYIVRGNNDGKWAKGLPRRRKVTIGQVRFFLTHDIKDVPEDLGQIDVIIYGHSHRFSEERKGNVLWLNPGSCGRKRFDLGITMCMVEVESGRYQIKRIEIL